MTMKAEMESLSPMLCFLTESLLEKGLSKRRALEVEIAAEEALVNIIKYAYGPGGKGDVELRVEDMGDEVIGVTFVDRGEPFNPTQKIDPPPSSPLSEREIGGLGLHLMGRLIDEIAYRREMGRNILTLLVKRTQ
jgi:anti-sigma regulatory factor (Ser/Thr protein kinase)